MESRRSHSSRDRGRGGSVFVPFAFFYMKQPLRLDFLWASLCILGAVYFMFRGHG